MGITVVQMFIPLLYELTYLTMSKLWHEPNQGASFQILQKPPSNML